MSIDTTIVIPTVGRPSLGVLLDALASQTVPLHHPVFVVDDRPEGEDLIVGDRSIDVEVIRTGGGGPARARNIGWRHTRTPWVSFLDDDVVPDVSWYRDLIADLRLLEDYPEQEIVGSQGRLTVPLPEDRRPTDWERGTASLETSAWITADMSYRRDRIAAAGGFDERFQRAFREDADLALRLGADRGRIVEGSRHVTHPVRPSDDWASLRAQAGNADDILMRAIHGPGWHERAKAPEGRRKAHLATTAAGALAVAGLLSRHRRLALAGAIGWFAGTAELAHHRIAPGPRTPGEIRRMLLTSATIPAAATWHLLRGVRLHQGATPWRGVPELVLLDRDGTLIEDVPYNGDPDLVRPLPGVREALDRLRAEGVRLMIVTNQSGIGRGVISEEQVDAVDERVVELLGPFEAVLRCPHSPDDRCGCRKPGPDLIKRALASTGVHPDRAVMVGDIGSDMEAARNAGVSGCLVPTLQTRREEIDAAAPRTAAGLVQAVDLMLGGVW
ncbi:HAD-IIIA family hydrolase [Nocardioides sp. NPDC057772]|uniref:HAD-IIIA family hydrolase n=1 Tax=Nocardioides sp. NPDC057772 TaxID=3346245 RepID=UPI00366F2447